jgi:RNA polymerase primary sigma factor
VLREHIADAMEALSPRRRRVLQLRFGLCGDREHTRYETATALGVSDERIRQLEQDALAKLRQQSGFRDKVVEYVAA